MGMALDRTRSRILIFLKVPSHLFILFFPLFQCSTNWWNAGTAFRGSGGQREEMGGREREMPQLCFVLYFFVAKC